MVIQICTAALCALVMQAEHAYPRNPHIYAAIVAHESAHGVGSENVDRGVAQVNKHTARAYGFDWARLQSSKEYNLQCGAKVLQDFADKYSKREPATWWCRYNVGSGPMIGKKLVNCKKYMEKVNEVYRTLYPK